MPTYNGGKYLREQLDSIYGQTMVPDEIVVVDDCSTDNTIDILEEYKTSCGLKYYINEKNLGYNKNFEKAIMLCSGDYILLCDQDDVWLPQKVEKCYNEIVKYPIDTPALVSCFSSTDPNILITKKGKKLRSGDWRLNYTLYVSQGCTLMFNRFLKEEILPFPDSMMYDAYLGLAASLIGNRWFIGEELMYYRIHQANSFQKNASTPVTKTLRRNLYKHVPLWFGYERYRSLKYIRNLLHEKAIPSHLEYLNKIISLYEVDAFKRLAILGSIKEIPLWHRIRSIVLLMIKVIFNIRDIV
jgi:glycosyltransferase involved in cell wall biosynthesis